MAALLAAGCGRAQTVDNGATDAVGSPTATADIPLTSEGPVGSSTSVLLPATSLAVQPSDVDAAALPLGPVYIDDDERCPESTNPEFGDGQAMTAESSRLEPMIGQVLAYGTEHADEFGTYGLVWHAAGDASVVISLTDNLEAHRSALVDVAAYPDELIVCRAAVSGASSRALQAALVEELAGRFISIGQGLGPIEVGLPASEQQLAGELVDRYGDIISVRVGNFAYPLSPDAQPVDGTCNADPAGSTDLNGLRATIELDHSTIGVGDEVTGAVTVTNAGNQPASFDSGSPLVASIVLPGTTTVVATYVGAIAGVGDGATLHPGESHTIPIIAGTASCDPSLGLTLPPGQYEVVVPVVVAYPQQAGDSIVNQLVASPASLTITS
jgi:hypothetical protein